MTDFALTAARRTLVGKKVSLMRKQGRIPAVLYGHGIASQHVDVALQPFIKVLKSAGTSSLVDLVVGEDSPVKVLIHNLQRNPVTDEVTHIDFYQVNMTEKIEAEIELVFNGVSPAVKELGGVLVKNKTSLQVKCLPGELVHEIPVDISSLKTFTDSILIKDLVVPASYQLLDNTDETVALVTPPRSDEEIAKLSEEVREDLEKVEVVGAKEKEEKAAEAAAAEGEAKPAEAAKPGKA